MKPTAVSRKLHLLSAVEIIPNEICPMFVHQLSSICGLLKIYDSASNFGAQNSWYTFPRFRQLLDKWSANRRLRMQKMYWSRVGGPTGTQFVQQSSDMKKIWPVVGQGCPTGPDGPYCNRNVFASCAKKHKPQCRGSPTRLAIGKGYVDQQKGVIVQLLSNRSNNNTMKLASALFALDINTAFEHVSVHEGHQNLLRRSSQKPTS